MTALLSVLLQIASGAAGAEAARIGKRVRRGMVAVVVLAVSALAGIGFLSAAAAIALAPVTGAWQAAALVGAALLLPVAGAGLAAWSRAAPRARRADQAPLTLGGVAANPVVLVLGALAAGILLAQRGRR